MYIPPPSTLPAGSIVDSYTRDSGGPRQESSTDQQLTEIDKYCATYQLVHRHKFVDVAKSGGSTADRDDFNRMMNLYEDVNQRPKGLLLWNHARFARDIDDAQFNKIRLRQWGLVIHSLNDQIPEGDYSRVIEFFIDISNEEKRKQTSSDAKRGLRELVEKYRCVPGTPPAGFKREPVIIGARRDGTPRTANRWIPDPDLIAKTKRAFEMRASGETLKSIHKEIRLYSSINSYKTFFANKIYIGILEFGDLVIENYCEPLIDTPTWNAVQKIIQDYAYSRTTDRHPRRAASPYLLTGLVFCEICGSPMSGNTTTRTYTTGRDEAYRCSRAKRRLDCDASRIPRHKLEQAVINTLQNDILQPENISAMLEIERTSVNHRETKRDERIAVLKSDKKKNAQRITNITLAIAERGHSPTLLNKLTELETAQAQINAELDQLNKTNYAEIPTLTEEMVKTFSETVINNLTNAPPEKAQQILKSIIQKITIKRESQGVHGNIYYYTPIPPTESPPFESAPTDGIMLPIRSAPVGALLYKKALS